MRALVTGGGGFLGGAIVRRLLAQGVKVRSLARGIYPELAKLGVETVTGDVADPGAVAKACEDVDIVYHVAAKAGVWGPRAQFHRANVIGTRTVLEACRRQGIVKLVYTSSPSVVFDGSDMEGVDESMPYPAHYRAPYPESKAEAERLVLAANGPQLATVALRPHLIWGPGDTQLVPRIVERGRAGLLRRIGDKACRVDSTYIDNAAEAHLLAGERLKPGSRVAGRAYFISNGEPTPLWELVDRILAAAGVAPVRRTISPRAAYAAGFVLESVYGLLGIRKEPRMTRFLAEELSTAHWFDISAAKNDLGYVPKVTLAEGLERLRAWLRAAPAASN